MGKRRSDLVRAAWFAAIQWTAVEVALRGPLCDLAVTGLHEMGRVSSPSDRFEVAAFLTAPIMAVLGAVSARRSRCDGLTRRDLGYRGGRDRIIAGVLAGAAVLMMSVLAGIADATLFDRPAVEPPSIISMRTAGTAVWLALLLGNGIMVPLIEEFAWRGYIQTRLAAAWGPGPAAAVTAVLFAVKHVVVDQSVLRVVTLMTGALALGVIGRRYGTTASTLAHVILNLAGTAASIAAAILTAPP